MKKLTVLALLILSIVSLSGISARASSTVIGPSTIHKGKNAILTTSDILGFYTSNLGTVSISIDNYTGNGNRIGTYDMEIYATDGVEIVAKNIEIVVVESLPSNIKAIGDSKDLYINNSSKIDWHDIRQSLLITDYINITSTTQVYILNDGYSESYQTPGTYLYDFRLIDASGYDNSFTIKIIVKDTQVMPEPDYVFEPEPSFFDSIVKMIKALLIASGVIFATFMFFKYSKKIRKKVSR